VCVRECVCALVCVCVSCMACNGAKTSSKGERGQVEIFSTTIQRLPNARARLYPHARTFPTHPNRFSMKIEMGGVLPERESVRVKRRACIRLSLYGH
jgi:hypothetical protein